MSPGVRIAAAVAALACAVPAAAAGATRPDPLLDQQWPLARESVLGRAAAWQQTTGGGALVAILDTGADFAHVDLQGAFWTNPAEIAGNGIDDDKDGYVDDVHGADIVNDDGDPSDDEGHGTHVAGIIAARAGNGEGGAGLAPDARIMIVKVLDEHRAGTAGGLADGIRYAVAHGAQIINTSVNGEGTSRPLQEAIRAAGAAGAVVVASAGNDGRSLDVSPSYPASYNDLSIISVASTGLTGELSSFSNRGLTSVDVAAPGEDVLSTSSDGGYELRSGTSMATPYVSATLALLQSVRPDLQGAGLKAALLAGTRSSAVLTGLLGGGALDAAAALRGAVGATDWQGTLEPLSVTPLPATRAARGAVLNWSLGGDAAAVSRVRVSVDNRTVATRPALTPDFLRVRARAGLHRFRVVALDAAGEPLAEAGGSFRVRKADTRAAKRRARAARHRRG
ncbi:MAG: S8 family peptidase [Solirubrobacteraceae bacterium]